MHFILSTPSGYCRMAVEAAFGINHRPTIVPAKTLESARIDERNMAEGLGTPVKILNDRCEELETVHSPPPLTR